MKRVLPFLALALAAAAPAPQPLQPTRDVQATYQVEGEAAKLVPGGLSGPVTLSWDAKDQKLRAEAQGRSQVALIDLRGHSATAFDTGLRVSGQLPIRPGDLKPLTLEGASLRRTGTDKVAGLPCTAYTVEGPRGGTVCLTADGVPLRGEGEFNGKPGRFQALSVSYGALPDALFTVPQNYIPLGGAAGALLGGAAGGGGGGMPDLRSLGRSLLGNGR